MLKQLLRPFSFHAGTTLGSGKQFISWIHLKDEIDAICFLAENASSSGPYNLTSPKPVTMGEMISLISRITGKPAYLKIPGFLLRAAMGPMASETILSSQEVIPSRLLKEGFRFKFEAADAALDNLLRNIKL
jgi:NAD dependent epimerase/dehydratase family enzyme